MRDVAARLEYHEATRACRKIPARSAWTARMVGASDIPDATPQHPDSGLALDIAARISEWERVESCSGKEEVETVVPGLDELRAEVARVFGIATLRPFHEQAIRASLDRRDLVLGLPTGGGKSLCFQAPARARSRTTPSVSPLV